MFEQIFKNIDDVLWKEAGCTTELDYTEQTSWLLFLKYLDDLEQERALEAELAGKSYEFIIDEAHRWSAWAAPKKADGTVDHDHALIGDDLIDYVNRQLFPYLQGFKLRATSPDTIEYKIGEIFSEIKNRFQSWYYQLEPGRNMGKTNSLNDEDLREFVELQARFTETEKSWLVDIADINRETFDLSVKNPNKAEEALLREPQEILDAIAALDAESAEILDAIAGMVCS